MSVEYSPFSENAPSPTSSATPGTADYAAIFAAVMETERGRWFLSEYARRNRHADTAEVLAAIEGLAAMVRPALAGPQPHRTPRGDSGPDMDRLRAELADMANAIARTKDEIASIHPDTARGGRIMEATEQLDSVVRTTERATSDILAAAEQVQEVAWTMREQGMESEFCDRLDGYATEIYTACSFQDVTGQRTRKIIHVLRYLEARIQSMTGIWGAATQANPPAMAAIEPASLSDDLSQNDLDRLMAPQPATPDVATAVEPPVVEFPDGPGRSPPPLPSAVPTNATKSTLTIEGPTGSFSILTGRTTEPHDTQTVTASVAAPPPIESDRLAAGLRAFAASLMAEYHKDSAVLQSEPLADAVAAPPSSTPTDVATLPVTAPAHIAAKAPPGRQPEIVLPLAVAPPLGDPPQRPAPEPVPSTRRKSDLAEDLFADVMALSDDERIALFT